jgi:hypothetical protein
MLPVPERTFSSVIVWQTVRYLKLFGEDCRLLVWALSAGGNVGNLVANERLAK